MPSLVTHLAIAKRYTELHPGKIIDINAFYKGSLAPDLDKYFSRMLSRPEKAITHYYSEPNEDRTNFDAFKSDTKVDLTDDYWKGYFAHLLADHLFYVHYFKREVNLSIEDNTNLYDDFTILTSKILEDYHPKLDSSYITDVVKYYLATKNGECRYLDYAKIHSFIEKVSANLDYSIQKLL